VTRPGRIRAAVFLSFPTACYIAGALAGYPVLGMLAGLGVGLVFVLAAERLFDKPASAAPRRPVEVIEGSVIEDDPALPSPAVRRITGGAS